MPLREAVRKVEKVDQGPAGSLGIRPGRPKAQIEALTGGPDEPEEHGETRLPAARFVRGDHRLGDVGADGEGSLREPGTCPGLTQDPGGGADVVGHTASIPS